VIGEEQIYDIELDKKTHIGPPFEPSPTNYKAFWKFAEDSLANGNTKSGFNITAPQTFSMFEFQ